VYPTYRYAWLRDGAFAAVALDAAGETDAAARFHDWVASAILSQRGPMLRAMSVAVLAGRPGPDDGLVCRFTVDGDVPRGDWGSFQMDGPGLWLWALGWHLDGDAPTGRLAEAVTFTARYLAALWSTPSYDAWEENGDAVSTSTLGAVLSGLRSAASMGIADAATHSAARRVAERLHVLAAGPGWLPKSNRDRAPDASLLWLRFIGAFEAGDPVWLATLARLEAELSGPDGGIHRYPNDAFYGGGEWPLLTAALGLACLDRAGPGDRERAEAALAWIDAQRDPGGALPEQVTTHALRPDGITGWVERWGPVARPLTWSHAMALLLRLALSDMDAGRAG